MHSKRISRRRQIQQQSKESESTSAEAATAKGNDTTHNSSQPTPKNPHAEPLSSSSNTNSPLNPNSNNDNHNEEAEEEDSASQRLNNGPNIQQPQQQEPTVVVDSNGARSNKRQKPSPDGEDLSPKKQNFERIWSDEYEIVILEGVIEYMKTGSNPSSDWSAFHEFIKPSLHCDFTRIQVGDKIRRLRRKYLRNAKKSKNRDGPHLLDSHEEMLYGLSKKIWGGKPFTVESGFQSSQKAKEVTVAVGPPKVVATAVNLAAVGVVGNGGLYADLNELLNFGRNLNAVDWGESLLKRGLDLIEKSKAEELSEKWKKLQMMKMEVHLNQVALYRELGMLAMEALKSSS